MAGIQDVEMFVAVVEAGSLSAAARRLARTQPTVSRQLAGLEARLGARLLERTTRRLRLTAAGRTYFERCTALLALAREADAAVADTHRAMHGAIRLSVPPTYARCRIAPLLPAFLTRHPELRLEMLLTDARTDVIGEPLDLVVRLGPLPDSSLACRLLSREQFVLCAAPAYLRQHGAPASVAELATRACLATERFGLRRSWPFRGARRQTVEVSARLISDDLAMLQEAARRGLGIAALPSYLVADDLRAGVLKPVLPRERLPSFNAHALLPSGRHVPRRVRALVDYLAAQLRGLSGSPPRGGSGRA
jgi:DNA-binding transcriptional LysR family regulator